MGLRSALVDRAYLVRNVPDERRVEGRRVYKPSEGEEIRARLTLSQASERRDEHLPVTEPRPTLTLYRRDRTGGKVLPKMSDRIRVVSKELGEALWEVEGEPRPLRKKRTVIGWELSVKRLEENANPRPG